MTAVTKQESSLWFSIPVDEDREEDRKIAAELSAMATGMRRTLIRHLLAEALCCDKASINKTMQAAIERRDKRGEKKRGRPSKKGAVEPRPIVSRPIVPVQTEQKISAQIEVPEMKNEVKKEPVPAGQAAKAEDFSGLLGTTTW